MPRFWMVRCGGTGEFAEEFLAKGCVAVGFEGTGDVTSLTTLEAIEARIREQFPEKSPTQIAITAGVLNKFRSTIKIDEQVVMYDPETRRYHLGQVTGDYEFRPGYVIDLDHIRSVSWTTQVSRDDLTLESRSSLGAALTIFEPGETVLADLLRVRPLGGNTEISLPEPIELREEVEQIYADQLSRSHEFIKDRLNRLEPRDMELLAAALLRSLGFRTRVTPGGPDRGRDVVASMDGLGLQPPRVLCEVKHRKGQQMGSQDIRSFVAGLRSDDRGLYLSSGGFTREAKYEAERAAIPTTLLDLDELAKLVVEHYERFDTAGKALIPLERFYWPKP